MGTEHNTRKVLASAIQQQFWLLNTLNPESPAYNIVSIFKINGTLDFEKLQKSINIIVNHYEILRSTFIMEMDTLFQVIHTSCPISVSIDDYNGLLYESEEVTQAIDNESTLPFDLEKGPLIRCKIFRLKATEYILVLSMHHIITDLRSNDIFSNLLSTLYNSETIPENVNNEKLSYANYSQRHHEWLKSSKFNDMLDFYKNTLSTNNDVLNLPLDHARPAFRRFSGKAIKRHLTVETVKKIRDLCQDPSLNSFVVLLSAYIAFLHRYCGQDRIITGVPYANRRKSDIKDTLGCFVNILPVAVTINENTTFSDLLILTRNAVLDVHSRQEVPLEHIVKSTGAPSDPSYNPAYQCGLTFKHPMHLSLQGLTVKPVFFHQGGSQLDIFASFWDTEDTIQYLWEYDSDILDTSTVQRMCDNFTVLLESALNFPTNTISQLPIITEAESALIQRWSTSKVDFDRTICIHELFEKQVLIQPDKVAVVFENGSLTFDELNQRSNIFAWNLKKKRVKPGDLVGICVDRTPEMLIGVLGILKSGGAYVPLDSEIPLERLDFVIADAGIVVLATHTQLSARLSTIKIPVICIDAPGEADENKHNPPLVSTPESIAYVIFTSGSTGRPKGVLIQHRSVVNVFNYLQRTKNLTQQDTWLSVASYTFDVSVPDLFLAIGRGATVVFASKESSRDGKLLSDLIQKFNATVLQATPTAMRILVESGWEGSACLKVLCAGEPLTRDLVEQLLPKVGILWNEYGPTETTIYSTGHLVTSLTESNFIGSPIDNTTILILDKYGNPVPIGIPGELFIGGEGVGLGYLNRQDLTKERFKPVSTVFNKTPSLYYRTGDLVRWNPEGILEYIQRIDNQVKIRGFRIELGEIEQIIQRSSYANQCVTIVRDDITGEKQIVAYIAFTDTNTPQQEALNDIRRLVGSNLPIYMHPSFYVVQNSFPKTLSGKINRNALPRPELTEVKQSSYLSNTYSDEEKRVAEIWSRLLRIQQISPDVKFFEAGGTSLLAARLSVELQKIYNRRIPVSLVFQHPTIRELAAVLGTAHCDSRTSEVVLLNNKQFNEPIRTDDIAVVGMACRFSGANSIDEFWNVLSNGQETIQFFEDEKIPDNFDKSIRAGKTYIRAKGILSNPEYFDADFFGFSRQTALVNDPQIRVFIETAYNALEDAGYTSNNRNGPVGVFAGMGRSLYLRNNILTRPDIIDEVGELQIDLGNEKDFLSTRLSHILNLRGPSINVSTACSTSLVATILACQSIQRGECNLALAGGCEISFPVYRGHLHQEGSIFSVDGHCRSFDANATGTVFSDGIGVVILKRLSNALADKNTIYAVIKGGAINNDGSKKVSYTAPGVDGQVDVIVSAQKSTNIPAETISYVETHGTATPLGDPIEIESLTQAFRKTTKKKQFCAIGAVKSNIGHTGVAAGIAGFIKTVLMLHHKTLVPSINFSKPNPAIDFESSPFYVSTKLAPWKSTDGPRRAGVSSFGFGGTNAHVILEEAPQRKQSGPSRDWKSLFFSAKSPKALETMIQNFGTYLNKNETANISDCAYTLQTARQPFPYRCAITGRSREEILEKISQKDYPHAVVSVDTNKKPLLVFMFPGQGNQYIGMGRQLYEKEAVFHDAFDTCSAALQQVMDVDIKKILFVDATDVAQEQLRDTYFAQTTIFAIEYALANLWMAWGLKPDLLVGHSIGEFTAACISGILDLENTAKLVAIRARLMSELPSGSMLSVRLSEEEVLPLLGPEMSIAAVNSPGLCVVSGPHAAAKNFSKICDQKDIVCRQLHTSHAFHSEMMEPAIPAFEKELCKIKLSPPKIPIISTVTGCPLTDKQASDPQYWARHMRVTVRFSNAIQHILTSEPKAVFLEVGPRATSTILARQQIKDQNRYVALASLGESNEIGDEVGELIHTAGSLWEQGLYLDWDKFYKDEIRNPVSLPPYPFDRKRYWIEPGSRWTSTNNANSTAEKDSSEQVENPTDMASATSAVTPDKVTNTLVTMVAAALGCDAATIDTRSTFLQMGMDSLFLTQLTQRLKANFGTQVSMRQLMRDLSTIEKLALHINSSI